MLLSSIHMHIVNGGIDKRAINPQSHRHSMLIRTQFSTWKLQGLRYKAVNFIPLLEIM